MRLLDLTLPTPAENLALDEALLDAADEHPQGFEALRLWEPASPMVVVGRSSRPAAEVHLETCRRMGIPVLRRTSGGAAVVAGPGCLMYALVLGYALRPALRAVDAAHRFVLGRLTGAIRPLVPGIACRGSSDLVLGDLKFSGNSVRCKRRHLLYHGTLLYDFPLELIDRCLPVPPRQPEYRRGRPHHEFLTNLPIGAAALGQALAAAWEAGPPMDDWPRARTARLAAAKYARPEWNEAGRATP
jgi:lipoate-protein ligase A